MMKKKVGIILGESIGEVEKVDNSNGHMAWGKFLRVRVLLNVTKPFAHRPKPSFSSLRSSSPPTSSDSLASSNSSHPSMKAVKVNHVCSRRLGKERVGFGKVVGSQEDMQSSSVNRSLIPDSLPNQVDLEQESVMLTKFQISKGERGYLIRKKSTEVDYGKDVIIEKGLTNPNQNIFTLNAKVNESTAVNSDLGFADDAVLVDILVGFDIGSSKPKKG
ncbi:hypothetical protein PTKIN_Ptkin01aG0102000 [Pterospermum kingtungense]